MGVGFSFESSMEDTLDLDDVAQYIEHKGFKKITGNFYLSNTYSVVDVVVLIQDILQRYPKFENIAKQLNYYRIDEVCSMQSIVYNSSNSW